MKLKEIKKTIDELVEIRNSIAKQPNFMLYKKDILNRLDFSICYERVKYVRNNQTIKKLCIFWNDKEIQIKY